MPAYYRIVEWSKYQHYRDRNPPWIKLHRDTLTSRTWVSLDDAGRVLALACMLIAADTENQIPADPDFIRRRAYLDYEPDFEPLVRVGFLELCNADKSVADASKPEQAPAQADASAMLADARPETETEGESEQSRAPPIVPPKGDECDAFEIPDALDRRDAGFERFYSHWPRKVGRGQALRAWRAACKKADPETIIEAAEQFAAAVNGTDVKFIPHAATWLNGERWLDDLDAAVPGNFDPVKYLETLKAEEADDGPG